MKHFIEFGGVYDVRYIVYISRYENTRIYL